MLKSSNQLRTFPASMSKAFTKETETDLDADLPDEPDPLPAGFKNYITPDGLKRLRAELNELWSVERPKVVEVVSWAAGNGDRSENGDYIYGKKRLREIDSRLEFLTKRLDELTVVVPQDRGDGKIFVIGVEHSVRIRTGETGSDAI